MTQKEIAEILDISLENVKIRLHRARAKLKESLNDGCSFYHNEEGILACDRKPITIQSSKNPKKSDRKDSFILSSNIRFEKA